ncbi:hypothetical protein HK098_002807 [Nowakowskiella sp. JEL0407]|nr:hypothetical protein HK098_002807 [Nowakowskiella sp. JEL0407]
MARSKNDKNFQKCWNKLIPTPGFMGNIAADFEELLIRPIINMTTQTPSQSVSSVLSTLTERIKPAASGLGKSISQNIQYARESSGLFGEKPDVTELPAEYRELEEKVDRIKHLHENFLKVARNYTLKAYDWEAPVQETVTDFIGQVSERATNLAQTAAKAAGVQNLPPQQQRSIKDEPPRSLSHAFARAASSSADELSSEDPLGAALRKIAIAEDKVGEARLKQDAEATAKFVQPFTNTLTQLIGSAMKARAHVRAVRLNYDAARGRLKAARPERVEAARTEMEVAEDEFVAAVDDAMGKMKVVVENPEPLKNLADLIAIQLQYFKSAHEILAELSPEIDELQVTNEALLRNSAN